MIYDFQIPHPFHPFLIFTESSQRKTTVARAALTNTNNSSKITENKQGFYQHSWFMTLKSPILSNLFHLYQKLQKKDNSCKSSFNQYQWWLQHFWKETRVSSTIQIHDSKIIHPFHPFLTFAKSSKRKTTLARAALTSTNNCSKNTEVNTLIMVATIVSSAILISLYIKYTSLITHPQFPILSTLFLRL